MKIQSSNVPTKLTSYPMGKRPEKVVNQGLDILDIDFAPRPSSIIALLAGPSLGLAAAKTLGLSNPAGLVLAGLASSAAGYIFFSIFGDR